MTSLPRRIGLAAALAGALCSCSSTGWLRPSAPHYLSRGQLQTERVAPPPAPGSAADQADLAALRDWQARRTAAECARAASEARATYEEIFGKLSPFPQPLPEAAAKLFLRVHTEADVAVSWEKDRFQRPRPFKRDPALQPCLGKIGGLAYPSGHATIARLFALILADLQPQRRQEFLARANEAAEDRVIGGVHHPSDIEAGKRLGAALYARFRESPAFDADLEALRRLLPR